MSNNLKFTNQFHDYGLPKPTAANPTDFLINIQYLDEKINATTKRLTYWDLYRISSVLVDASAFQSTINNLLPYESMIVNTKINTGDENGDYNTGDIVIKNNDGTHTKIKAERGGIFYPSKITKSKADGNYTYIIDYSYNSASPTAIEKDSKDNEHTENNVFMCEYAKTMSYSGLMGSVVGSPYNAVYATIDEENNSISEWKLNGVKDNKNGEYVSPIVKCFTKNNNQLEEVYCDIKIDFQDTSENTYTITLQDSSAVGLVTKVVIK